MYEKLLQGIVTLIILGAVGYILAKQRIFTDTVLAALSRLITNVTLPCLAFYSIVTNLTLPAFFGIYYLPLIALFFIFIGFVIGMAYLPFIETSERTSNTFLHLMVLNNFSFLPLPLIAMLYGDYGIAVLFMLSIGFQVGYWTLGVWTLSRSLTVQQQIRCLLNPCLLTILCSTVIAISGLKEYIPVPVILASQYTGTITIPLMMFVVGGTLYGVNLKQDILLHILFVILRLVFFPLLIIISLNIAIALVFSLKLPFTIPPAVYNIILIVSLMPAACTAPSLCKRFNAGDEQFAASAVFWTTACSVVTIPVLYVIFSR